MIAFGSVELMRAREHAAFCDGRVGGAGGLDSCVIDPPRLGYAAAGLSYAFSAPILIASGLLFARAARLRRGAPRSPRVSVMPAWGPRRFALHVELRF